MEQPFATVALVVAVLCLILWLSFGIFLLSFVFKIKRFFRKAERTITQPYGISTQNLVRPRGDMLRRDEIRDVRDILRRSKEVEALDSDTLDNATEFRRDFS